MKKTIGFSAVFAVALISTILVSEAHKGASGIVKQRMDSMKSIASQMKTLKGLLFGKSAYDAEGVKAAAELIKKHAAEVPSQFPKGSLNHPSEATDAVWKDFDGFKKEASRLAGYADIMILAADNPSDANFKMTDSKEISENEELLKKGPPQAAFFAMATTCQSCHQSYRKKK